MKADPKGRVAEVQEELAYHEKFLKSVEAKLNNPNFVSKAPEKIIAIERKKQSDAKEKIDAIYERTCYESNLIDFAELYRVILEFLRESKLQSEISNEELDDVILKFTFTLASQDFYSILIQ